MQLVFSETSPDCTIVNADSREALKDYVGKIDLIVTSPPYADARKKHYDSIKPDDYAEWFSTFHNAFWDALKPDGSLVINIKDKVVNGVRHRYVWDTIQALTNLGWFCIDDYVWTKTNPMPGYWPTRLSDGWEYCFHLAKSVRPFINQQAVKKPISAAMIKRVSNLSEKDLTRQPSMTGSGFGKNNARWIGKTHVLPSNVLQVGVGGTGIKHPAVFPIGLPEFFIKLLSPENALVCDPFCGSGTTALAALSLNRRALLIDNKPEYCEIARERISKAGFAV